MSNLAIFIHESIIVFFFFRSSSLIDVCILMYFGRLLEKSNDTNLIKVLFKWIWQIVYTRKFDSHKGLDKLLEAIDMNLNVWYFPVMSEIQMV
jgi:type IV secretory pathway VirB3-like protein